MSAVSPTRLLAAALAVGAVVLAGALLVGGGSAYRVRATFDNVAGLRKNSEVRIDGVRIGTVDDLSLKADDSVSVTLELDTSVAPIGRDARATIRSKNLLGQRLVDVEPGDTRRPLPTGGTISRSRTGTPVDLDELLTVLDGDTRLRLRALVHESGVALAGRGADFNRLIGELPRSLDQARTLLDELGGDNRVLKRLVVDSDRVVGALAPERGQLGELIGAADGALGTLAGRRRALRETLRRAPRTLVQARETLTLLRRAALPLRPAAARLRETAAPLGRTLRSLGDLEPSAVATFRSAKAAAPDLTQIAAGATPLVRRLRPAVGELARFAEAAEPVSRTLDAGIEDTLKSLEGWARAIQGRDGLGHYFRGHAHVNRDALEALVGSYVRGGSALRRSRPQGGAERAHRPRAGSRDEPRGPSAPGRGSGPHRTERPSPTRELERALEQLPGLDDLPRVAPEPPTEGAPADRLLDFLLGP